MHPLPSRDCESAPPQPSERRLASLPLKQLCLAVAALSSLAACSAPSYGLLDAPRTDDASLRSLYDPKRYHPATRTVLAERDLSRLAKEDPSAVPRQLLPVIRETERADPTAAFALRLAAAEVLHDAAVRQADSLAGTNPEAKPPTALSSLHLDAAQLSQPAWHLPDTADGENGYLGEALRALHDASTERAVLPLWVKGQDFPESLPLDSPEGSRLLRFEFRGLDEKGVDQLAEFLPAERLEIPIMKGNRPQPGYGAPLVAWAAGPAEGTGPQPFFPPVGRGYPVTVTLSFDRQDELGGPATATFYEANRYATIRVNGASVPLAADRAAPFGVMQSHRRERFVGKGGMFRPAAYDKTEGLFLLDDYDPDKIPVVYVHGLMSKPSTWRSAVIDLFEHPDLRDHYQPVMYNYPTGYPIPVNAVRLAKRLQEFRETYDPSGTSPTMNQTVIIGHSMGGLLSSFQVRSLGAGYIDAEGNTQKLLDVPPDRISDLTAEERENLDFLLRHRANPAISRAIFVCAPHRGSDWASNAIGRFGSFLVRFPGRALESVLDLDSRALWAHTTELGKAVLTHPEDGIENLRPDSIVLTALLQQPIGEHVRYHSIIGDRGREGPRDESSDGIVAYWSSQLEGAESETMVPHGHVATNEDETVAEIRRILRLHLEELGRNPATTSRVR